MKSLLTQIFCQRYSALAVMLIAPLFALLDRNFSYFFGLGAAFILLWHNNWNWRVFGFATPLSFKTVYHAIFLALCLFISIDMVIQPLLELKFGTIDLSSVDDIRGNWSSYLILMLIMWIFAAFGEEFLFSGYYLKQIAEFFGNSDRAWYGTAAFVSIYFGISHSYQGVAGAIAVGLVGAVYFFTFTRNRNNLWLLVLTHGVYDSLGITLIFLDQDRTFYHLYVSWLVG